MSEEIKKNILDEMKKLDESKEQLNKNIGEINNFSNELKQKLGDEDINIQNKLYELNIQKEKNKNENELNILTQHNEKMEKYIQLLSKQYELELQYIEQYCDYKSKVEKIGEKYAHINISNITPLKDLFSEQLNKNHEKKQPPKINIPKPVVKKDEVEESSTPTRRNTIAIVSENNPNKNDIRNTGNLQDHLKNALNKRFQNTGNNDE
jgi:hypothetical protein